MLQYNWSPVLGKTKVDTHLHPQRLHPQVVPKDSLEGGQIGQIPTGIGWNHWHKHLHLYTR